ncbi:MAG: glycosyltransferase family 2 protein [Deinococcota bacterium]
MSCTPDSLPTTWQVPDYEVQVFHPKRTRYCIGIPIINEGERIRTQLAEMYEQGLPDQADVILADGGSNDGSTAADVLEPVGVRTLLTKRGPGKLSAQLRMLFAYGLCEGYDGFVLIDGNGKDGVEGIPQFLEAMSEGWDYIQGSRYIPGGVERNTPLSRKLGVKFLHAPLLSIASGTRYTDTTNGFRAVSKAFLEDARLQPFRDVFDTYNLHYYLSLMAPKLGYQVKEVPVRREYPDSGAIPSKIKGLSANWHIMQLLFETVIGRYTPKEVDKSSETPS